VLGAGTIAIAHAVNDSYAYILPPLLPVLLTQSGVTLGMGAALVGLQLLASSVLQPVFGHWPISLAEVAGWRGRASSCLAWVPPHWALRQASPDWVWPC
jgi:hypothetical protein